MSQRRIDLPEVDSVAVRTIIDNSIDRNMSDTAVAKRPPRGPNPFERSQPIAQHGFSVLVEVRRGGHARQVMFDTGVSKDGILYNLDALEIDASGVQAIVLSHGHADHAMGLTGLIKRLGGPGLPLVLHPDAYLERKLVLPDGSETLYPPPKRSDLRAEGVELIEDVGPSMLVEGMVLVSGEVARTTTFETGFPGHMAKREHDWEPDPLITDDQCAIVNVRGKGLVIVTGCGHAGIINIIRNAQALTGIQQIYAVVGGFHLSGNLFRDRIAPTIAALKDIGPRWLVPGHCTGWEAIHAIARELPEAFIPNSGGTTLAL